MRSTLRVGFICLFSDWPAGLRFTMRYKYIRWIKRLVILFVPGYTAGLARFDPVSPGLTSGITNHESVLFCHEIYEYE